MLISSNETPTEGGAGEGVGVCSGSMITASVEFVNGSCAGVFSGDIGTIGKGVVVGSTRGRIDGPETLLSGKLHDVMATANSRSFQYLRYEIRVALEFEIMDSVKLNSSQPTEFVLGFEANLMVGFSPPG